MCILGQYKKVRYWHVQSNKHSFDHSLSITPLHKLKRDWSTVGLQTSVGDAIRCTSVHLTSFAVLVSVSSDSPVADDFALMVVSYVGCGVSIFFLLLTIVTLIIFRWDWIAWTLWIGTESIHMVIGVQWQYYSCLYAIRFICVHVSVVYAIKFHH